MGNTGWWKQKAELGRGGGGFKTNPCLLPRELQGEGFGEKSCRALGWGCPHFWGLITHLENINSVNDLL